MLLASSRTCTSTGSAWTKDKWKNRIARKKIELKKLISDVLDPYFLPLVGSKHAIASDDDIANADALWKSYNAVSDEELNLRKEIRLQKKAGNPLVWQLEEKLSQLEIKRKADKEIYKTAASDMKKHRTKVKNLAAKCEGEALINYSSDTQLLAVITGIKGLKSVTGLDDEILEKYESQGFAIMGAIRKLHSLSKEIGTYGDQWAMEWMTKPCKEEGWLNPGDGRLHCVYNQYDAETGRSSSEKPNGQNLPQDPEIRECFIADPPDESIRVPNCCNADLYQHYHVGTNNGNIYVCKGCYREISYADTHAQEYVIITADMSGAELRIIAELADDPVWIGAFNRGEDVHSVGTEILHEENWINKALETCSYYKLHTVESVLKNPRATVGDPQRQKCKCPEHAELRNDNKSTNFLLAYGGGPHTLMKAIKKTLEKAKELMVLHSQKFPRIWAYLDMSGKNARMKKRAFDMFGRRRLFPDPTYTRAKERFIDDNEVLLRLPDYECEAKLKLFTDQHLREPDQIEKYVLTHREPTSREINKVMGMMAGSIERQGKNHAIQGTNATIIKLAAGCGFDKDDKPYLWHVFPKYGAKVLKMVHDELVVQCPKQHAETVAALIGDAFARAALVKMKKVKMEFDYVIKKHWSKG
jgi:DNA polymerase I-like protein with 3'-5' exonuclease and polymerase domains